MSTLNREEYNKAPVIKPVAKIWFLNGDLVRVHHINRAAGIMSVYNITKDQIESCLVGDFKAKRERAYTVIDTGRLVNRHHKYLPTLMKKGIIPRPMGAGINGERQWQRRSYYSESQVREIRDILSTFGAGRPRKDGLITNNQTPTRQELTRRMGDGILTYTQTNDGRFIPVWTEMI